MRVLGFSLLLTLCFAFVAKSGTPDDERLESNRLTESTGRNLRVWIRDKGTQEAKSADSSVNFYVDDSVVPYAITLNSGSGNDVQIRMSNELRVLFVYFSDVDILQSQHSQFFPCVSKYKDYLFTTFAENAKRSAAQQPVVEFEQPEVFAYSLGGVCSGFDNLFPLPKDLRPLRDKGVDAAVGFLYFHELGHVALHHNAAGLDAFIAAKNDADRQRAFLAWNKNSRQQERDADAWAIQQLTKMGIPPQDLAIGPVLDIFLASSGLNCAFDSISTHDNALARTSEMTDAIRSAYVKQYHREISPELQLIFSNFKSLNASAKNQLQCP